MRREVLQNAIAAWQAWLLRIACGSYDDARAHTATKTKGLSRFGGAVLNWLGSRVPAPGPQTVHAGCTRILYTTHSGQLMVFCANVPNVGSCERQYV